jgi:SAM-dependent methyltransferase
VDNDKLKKFYNNIYKEDSKQFFSKYVDGNNISNTMNEVLSCTQWAGKTVLDFGCGEGELANMISREKASKVYGIDYSTAAITIANNKYHANNLQYDCLTLDNYDNKVDVIVSCGTLEHLNNPTDTIRKFDKILNDGGELILTCPYFLNIRGFIWITLQKLLDVPMSLTDLHSLSDFDIESFIAKIPSLKLIDVKTFDHEIANGKMMIIDMEKRLTNALNDANLPTTNIPSLLSWLEKVVELNDNKKTLNLCGSNALYYIKKNN